MTEHKRAWYAEPMVWLILTIPALTALAGGVTIFMAGDPATYASGEPTVRKTGQIQTDDMSADLTATALGLAAQLEYEPSTEQLHIQICARSEFAPIGPLILELRHLSEQSEDQRIELAANNGIWVTNIRIDTSQSWNLRLRDQRGEWQLLGRLRRNQLQAELNGRLRLATAP